MRNFVLLFFLLKKNKFIGFLHVKNVDAYILFFYVTFKHVLCNL